MDTDLIQVLEQMERLVASAQARLSRYVAVVDAARAAMPLLESLGTMAMHGYSFDDAEGVALADALDALEPKKEGDLRSEVAYLRCVEDAARMVVNAAKEVGDDAAASVSNLAGALEDLDESREEQGYWYG